MGGQREKWEGEKSGQETRRTEKEPPSASALDAAVGGAGELQHIGAHSRLRREPGGEAGGRSEVTAEPPSRPGWGSSSY